MARPAKDGTPPRPSSPTATTPLIQGSLPRLCAVPPPLKPGTGDGLGEFRSRPPARGRGRAGVDLAHWFLPLFAVALGLVMFAAQWIGGNPLSGLGSLGIMTAFGALFLFGGRSEPIRGLRGDGRDERFRQIDIHATAIAGLAVIAGLAYILAVALFRGRG